MTKLENCPFCGSEAVKKKWKSYRRGYLATVGCPKCAAEISQATLRGTVDDAYENATRSWNRRCEVTND